MRIGWFNKEGSSRDNGGADSTEFVDQTEFVEHGTYAQEIGWRTVRKGDVLMRGCCNVFVTMEKQRNCGDGWKRVTRQVFVDQIVA